MKALVSVLIFAISLAGGAALMSRVLPPVPVPQIAEKLAHFAAHRDDYDTLFIGSSRTFRQIIPAIFDPLMAAGGQPSHSFNFGIDAMFSPEDAYVAEKIFALRPKRLRRVFIEVCRFNYAFAAQPPETLRARHWHDWGRTALVCRYTLPFAKREKWRDASRWANVWNHTRLFFARAVNLGEGARLLEPWRGVAPPDPAGMLGAHGDGAIPSDVETECAGEDRAKFDRAMAALGAGGPGARPLPTAPLQSLAETIDRVRGLGAEPVLFIAPMAVTVVNSPAGQIRAPILDFSDPRRWPALFDPANRSDYAHLNAPGARLFSRLFAEQVLALPPGNR